MPTFQYSGVDKNRKQVNGEIKGADKNSVIAQLRKRGIRPTSVREKKQKQLGFMQGNPKLDDVSRFTRQFAAMIDAGLPLVQCMDILAAQTEVPVLQNALKEISMDIQGGNTLADSMRKHPKIFDGLYCNMIAAGEASGNLDEILLRLAEYMEKNSKLRRKVKGALTYPIVLIVVCVAATTIMLTFVVPTFADLFGGMGRDLPASTQLVVDVSNFLRTYFIQIVLIIVAIATGIYQYNKTEGGKRNIDKLILRTPVVGNLVLKTAVSRFSQTLGTLLSSGINIIQAMTITAKTAGVKPIEEGLLRSVEEIKGGKSISAPLKDVGIFPPMVLHMIAVGEKTGDISSMLAKVAKFYEEEVDAAVESLTSVIEPIMIVIMGIIIGSILIAMYMPMFTMIGGV
ncbi:type II secretion system F family protein [Chitinivibrio alkaliphilus]|uniref:Type IV pilus assembly protein PilC n=1 Tax=Chitinivibrio alkaliphilus ACht1 TaxID=1313304 RepID=U7D7Z0_9BACT|nr:type II secretion system F family protein [Chitinivibrio alkaliphilus]ERP32058.1 type IV pilus assembly protein PilC [Chitinivibrio alkaliphilus ACht1]